MARSGGRYSRLGSTAEFMRQDFSHGSGMIRDAAVAQLRAALPLVDAKLSPEVRARLMVATAYLALMAGWMSFEGRHHDAARWLWMIGLDLARHAEHPQATSPGHRARTSVHTSPGVAELRDRLATTAA